MIDRRRVRQSGEGPPKAVRNVGMRGGEALHVQLVDQRVGPVR